MCLCVHSSPKDRQTDRQASREKKEAGRQINECLQIQPLSGHPGTGYRPLDSKCNEPECCSRGRFELLETGLRLTRRQASWSRACTTRSPYLNSPLKSPGGKPFHVLSSVVCMDLQTCASQWISVSVFGTS